MTTEKMLTLEDILKSAREDLDERIEHYDGSAREYFDDYWEDDVSEIADSHVPVYTRDLLALAYNDLSLATEEPEIGPAFDGTPTPINIIAANVYEAISSDLYEYAQTLQDNLDDEDDED